jgi:hypothetical protein
MSSQPISAVSPDELQALKKSRKSIIEGTVARMLADPDFLKIFGDQSEEKALSGITFTAETFETIMGIGAPDMVGQQLSWGKDYLPSVGISVEMVLRNFELFSEVMQEKLPSTQYPGLANWMHFIISKQREIINT